METVFDKPLDKKVAELADRIATLGEATLLTTTNQVTSTPESKSFTKTGYSQLMVVLHGGSNPTTSTWFAIHTIPTNYYDIHTAVASLSWQSNGATGHADIRYDFTNASTIRVQLDSKSSNVTPYVSVYGVK